MPKKTTLLCILDGWGVQNKGEYDAIYHANTPNFDRFEEIYPNSQLQTYGEAVGLPAGQMGNSEVGHMNIGSGRIIKQSLPLIDESFVTGEFANNQNVKEQIAELKNSGKALHIMGLLSDGGVHSHISHIINTAKIYAAEGIKTYIHAFTDGRDTKPDSSINFLKTLQDELASSNFLQAKNITLATMCGRFFAMDRDKRWDRVEKAYNMIVNAEGVKSDNFIAEITKSHQQEIYDEFIEPVVNSQYQGFNNGDALLMANFRADRAREILLALLDPQFDGFAVDKLTISSALGMVEYSEHLNKFCKVIFTNEIPRNTLGEVIQNQNLKQLRIAETEKYAHVTFFFNGGLEQVFIGEERVLVDSPKVKTYDLKPEMSAYEVCDKLCDAIESANYDFIAVNFANPDMVGHSGVFEAAKKAATTIDECLGRLEQTILKNDGNMLVTADHGNLELMVDEQGKPHTQHTVGNVPFILVGRQYNIESCNYSKTKLQDGRLCDIAPTILALMGIEQPKEMTGDNLLRKD